MRKMIPLFIALFLVISLLILLFLFMPNSAEVCFEQGCIKAEIADTPEKRTKGLMFRKALADDQGMLFVYEGMGQHSFWMKNTYIPLAIIWIDENMKVVHVENAMPCKEDPCPNYRPDVSSRYVIEVTQEFGKDVRVGEKVSIEI